MIIMMNTIMMTKPRILSICFTKIFQTIAFVFNFISVRCQARQNFQQFSCFAENCWRQPETFRSSNNDILLMRSCSWSDFDQIAKVCSTHIGHSMCRLWSDHDDFHILIMILITITRRWSRGTHWGILRHSQMSQFEPGSDCDPPKL